MDKKELDILIDKSILGTLSQSERSKLDEYIMEQPNIKLEIQMRTDLIKGLEYNADLELKSLLNKIHKEEISVSNRYFSIKKIGLAALLIGVVLGVFGLFKYLNSEATLSPAQNSALYASYFEPFSPSLETRSNDYTQEEVYLIFIDAYRTKDYRKSLETISPFLNNADNNTLLMASISAMQTDKLQESKRYLDRIIASDDFYFIDHAKWYKALLLLKMEKPDEAKPLLNDLANNPKADHHNESVSILKEL